MEQADGAAQECEDRDNRRKQSVARSFARERILLREHGRPHALAVVTSASARSGSGQEQLGFSRDRCSGHRRPP
jgi:hypothetical protein